MRTRHSRSWFSRSPGERRLAAGLLAGLLLATEAGAVVTVVTGYFGTRRLTLRIGTANSGIVDTVSFDVPANSVGSGPVAASSGGVVFRMYLQVPANKMPQSMTTTVDSSVGLTCTTAATCGGTIIPFSDISWVVTPAPSGPYAPFDLQNGTFTGNTAQPLLGWTISGPGGTAEVLATMNFTFANSTVYPAGTYQGRVTYTTTLP